MGKKIKNWKMNDQNIEHNNFFTWMGKAPKKMELLRSRDKTRGRRLPTILTKQAMTKHNIMIKISIKNWINNIN